MGSGDILHLVDHVTHQRWQRRDSFISYSDILNLTDHVALPRAMETWDPTPCTPRYIS